MTTADTKREREPRAPSPPAKGAQLTQDEPCLLPLVPEQVKVSPLLLGLLHTAAFLDLAGDDHVDAAAAGRVLARVGLYVQRLDDERVEQIADELELLVEHAELAKWPLAAREFVSDFLRHCGFVEDTESEGVEREESEA